MNYQYPLEDRVLEFGKRIVRLCQALPKNIINTPLINQIIRSGTAIGANYCEANETKTKKDLRFKVRLSLKEAKETIYWLKLIIAANPSFAERMKLLLAESQELVKIFSKILTK